MPFRDKRKRPNSRPARYLVVRRKPTLLVAMAAALGAGGILAWTGVSATALEPKAAAHPVVATGPLLVKPRVPAHGAYLGIDPNFATGSDGVKNQPDETALDFLSGFETAIARPAGLVSFYTAWASPPPIASMEAVSAEGSIPMVSWHCGPPDANVAAAQYDGLIAADAEAYKAFAKPVLLRWFWEMNLTSQHESCLEGTATLTPAVQETDYGLAFQHIWTIFQHVGATNVGFVWAPSGAQGQLSATGYYPCQPVGPGCDSVDWVGVDMYDRTTTKPPTASFQASFSVPYGFYDSLGKPIMLTETGAPQGAGPPPNGVTQVAWLQEIEADGPAYFPDMHGFVYVDAVTAIGNYTFTAAGLTTIKDLGETGYFSQLESGIR